MAKNTILAAILSFILPGLGEIYVGKLMFGIILVIIGLIAAAAIFMISSYG